MNAAELYTDVESLEPLLPSIKRQELAELTLEITGSARGLTQQLPSVLTRRQIAELVAEMNSYYSNLIEGNKTFPREIEQAMRNEYASDASSRANQHYATAHIKVEEQMRQKLSEEPELRIQSPEFIQWLHQAFYEHLPAELHVAKTQSGTTYPIEPGAFRAFEVRVGNHQPPHYGALPAMMQRLDEFYGSDRILATNQLLAAAAAHHRLVWIHPFGDGNGRVARLLTQAWLIRCGVDSDGLWTISRGLARTRDAYYDHLQAADSRRLNDFDGRGNLSDQKLAEFCLFFLQTMVDQIAFMSGLLEFHRLAERMESHLHIQHSDWSLRHREQIGRILKQALVDGEIERGEAARAAGVSKGTGQTLIKKLLAAGLMSTPSPKGRLRLVFDANVLETYFPKLFQDLPLR